jgi:cardiolipin synthase
MPLKASIEAERAPWDARDHLRAAGEQAFSRAAGAPLVLGNRLELLLDAEENFPAWLEAIEGARRLILLEAYILADDVLGNRFADALVAAARRGVRVRLLYDWLGARGEAPRRFWRRLEAGGVEVRCFNPFRVDRPLGWLRRNHRKSLVVDGSTGFVTGLCIAERWMGDPRRGRAPWRDTGVRVEGPAVADLARAFSRVWAEAGPAIPAEELVASPPPEKVGDVALRVIGTEPATAGLLRLDQLIAATARRTLWLTDAYFVGSPLYVQSLRAAALDGVDVRFLVPGASDLGLVKRLGTAGYRPLLEAGVRVFEWDGPMLHAKTAVADGRWARVGSSNLNVASWLGNWELDVAVEDEGFAREMESTFEEDLEHATEVVLGPRYRPLHPKPTRPPERPRRPRREGSAVKTAGAMRIGNTVGAALGGYRVLGPAEAALVLAAGTALALLAVAALLFPRVVLAPFIVLGLWLGAALLLQAFRLRAGPPAPPRDRADRPAVASTVERTAERAP